MFLSTEHKGYLNTTDLSYASFQYNYLSYLF